MGGVASEGAIVVVAVMVGDRTSVSEHQASAGRSIGAQSVNERRQKNSREERLQKFRKSAMIRTHRKLLRPRSAESALRSASAPLPAAVARSSWRHSAPASRCSSRHARQRSVYGSEVA